MIGRAQPAFSGLCSLTTMSSSVLLPKTTSKAVSTAPAILLSSKASMRPRFPIAEAGGAPRQPAANIGFRDRLATELGYVPPASARGELSLGGSLLRNGPPCLLAKGKTAVARPMSHRSSVRHMRNGSVEPLPRPAWIGDCNEMETADEIGAFVERQADMMRLLRAVNDLALPDCWIGAGFIRNAVWDALHGREPNCALLNDVDVVFFDRVDASAARDEAIEAKLTAQCPKMPWSVRNQARMHLRNNEPAYPDTAGAIARWPETATAIAARLSRGRVEILAPHSVDDLVRLIVRPTPAFIPRQEEFADRLSSKNWQARWPRLKIITV